MAFFLSGFDVRCRRLFLRGWKPHAVGDATKAPTVDVDIWVSFENSDARRDELEDVLDYNVMRDALLQSGYPDSNAFIERALDRLMEVPVEAASIELRLNAGAESLRGSRLTKTRA